MNKRSDLREFVRYASLNAMGMIGLSCYILADTFFISRRLGADGLAALNLAIPIYSFIHGSGLMLGMGGATKYSIFKAHRAAESADRIFTNTLYAAFVLAVMFLLTGCFFSDGVTALLRADGQIYAMTKIYLKVILLFAPAFMLNDILICFVRNDDNPRLAMLAMLGGSFSNIVLDYILIFPFHMGIFGAVLATGLAPIVSMLILSKHWTGGNRGFHFVKTKPHFAMIGSGISLGFPSLITEVSSGIVMIVFNFIILGIKGNVGIAAYGVIANLSLVVTAVYTGIAQGAQPILSRAYGAGNMAGSRRILRYAVMTLLVLSGVIYLGMYMMAESVTGIFNSEGNAQLRKIAVSGLRLYFTAAPFVGINIVLSLFFTSTEQAVPAHMIALLRGLILIIPAAFFLSHIAGITGTWLAFPVTEGIVCLLGVTLYWSRRRMPARSG